MGFLLAGLICRAERPRPGVVALPQGFELIRLRGDGEPVIAGLDRLDEAGAAIARELSTDRRVAYVEAEFIGGEGTQAAVGWEAGEIAFGPRLTRTSNDDREGFEPVPWGSGMAIDEVLRWLGVERHGGRDEFDTLALNDLDELRVDDDVPVAAVAAFVAAVRLLPDVASLLREARAGDRQGSIAPGVRYAVHGAGCRFTLADGAEVDVDVDLHGLVFDAWRVREFARSRGDDVSEPDLRAALERHPDVVEVRPGWFTTP